MMWRTNLWLRTYNYKVTIENGNLVENEITAMDCNNPANINGGVDGKDGDGIIANSGCGWLCWA